MKPNGNILTVILCCVALLAACASVPAQSSKKPAGFGKTMLGIDVLEERGFDSLKGKNVGLITNQTGLSRDNKSTIDVLNNAPDVNVVALFGPEHGLRGGADEAVASGTDEQTGLPVYSLYGKDKVPTAEMLKGIDVLVFDIQDIGARFYTNIGTMAYCMEAAAEHKIKFVVLDRTNPIGGTKVEGVVASQTIVDATRAKKGLTCIYPIPTRHGMTIGELAWMFNEHFGIGCDLEIVKMKNWSRDMYFDETGLMWVNTSPNMKTLNGALLYPGMGAAEGTWISCGRGLDRPFEMYGAPYMDADKLTAEMNSRNLPGMRFVATDFTPRAKYHKHENQLCHGIFVVILDRDEMEPARAGLHMVQAMEKLFPDDYKAMGGFATLFGDEEIWPMLIDQGKTPEEVLAHFEPGLEEFKQLRAKYLLYD